MRLPDPPAIPRIAMQPEKPSVSIFDLKPMDFTPEQIALGTQQGFLTLEQIQRADASDRDEWA
ncbi:hypothetical protein Asp14428_32800 [Actinoplanes sp. NBRC 14428]|nr:hypothetical protein Asp14428_32800 [Actinoplanes sp. NBRC 14428]